jgi:hypothetical protein
MSEYDNIEQELATSLAALENKPCGCQETSENPFAGSEVSSSDDLMKELELALSSLGSGHLTEQLSVEEAMEFASVTGPSGLSLDDIVSILERNPGLKITFSL